MRIAIGANPARYQYKEGIKKFLESKGHSVIDLSCTDPNDTAWVTKVCRNVAQAIEKNHADRGIVICGTGMGVSIAANKNKGARCAMAESYWAAMQSRIINDANIMALGADITSLKMACAMAQVFITTEFLQRLDAERSAKLKNELKILSEYEDSIFK